jgi:hypothetical protein
MNWVDIVFPPLIGAVTGYACRRNDVLAVGLILVLIP